MGFSGDMSFWLKGSYLKNFLKNVTNLLWLFKLLPSPLDRVLRIFDYSPSNLTPPLSVLSASLFFTAVLQPQWLFSK